TSRFSFMSITMPPMIDPFTTFQTHPSLETRSQVQTHTILEKTAARLTSDKGLNSQRRRHAMSPAPDIVKRRRRSRMSGELN
ncbi:MAG: hypothetical protein ACREYE_09380, partial [Gammaproteobacteria bacterium]